MTLRGVVFDLDDTLVHGIRPADLQPVDLHYLSWCTVLTAEGCCLAADDYREHMRGRSNAHCDAFIAGHCALPPGTTLSPAKERHYREELLATHLRLRGGVEALLAELAAAGVKLGIATNAPAANVAAACENTVIPRWFAKADIVDADELGARGLALKPAPDAIALHAERWSLAPAELLFVGDSSADVRAARQAGVAMLAITAGYDAASLLALGASATFESFEDLTLRDLQRVLANATGKRQHDRGRSPPARAERQ